LRMKVNFSSLFTKNKKYGLINIPGELIDISIPDKKSSDFQKVFTIKNSIENYTFLGKYDNLKSHTFNYYSYSFYLFFEDLMSTIVKYSKILWEGIKYEKRMNRIYAMIIIDLFYNPTLTYDNRKNLIKTITDIIKNYKIINFKIINTNLQNYLTKYKNIAKNNDIPFINIMISYVCDMFNDNSFENKLANDKLFLDNYLEFFKNFNDMMILANDVNELHQNYKLMNNLGSLKNRLLTTNQLGGDNQFLNKYLKYKSKYLNLKK